MIIAIDISSIPYKTGVSDYTLNLVRNLLKIDKTNTYKLFYSSLRLPLPTEIAELKKQYSNIEVYQFKIPPTLLQILWNQLHIIPIEFFIGKCDLFHTSDWTQAPTSKAKTITTVHDLIPFINPAWHSPKVIKAHANKMYWAAKECSTFICVSQNTKSDLLKLFPNINPQKIEVVYEAAEEKYSQFLELSKTIQEQQKDDIKKRYKLNDFILVQGTREPRKNIENIIKAFNLFQEKKPNDETQLAITGKYGWGDDVSVKNKNIKVLGFIPEQDMVAIHAAALCLLYPSLYEGFGLPLVKSMSVSTPIITSNTSCLPEIAANSALLVDPKSPQDISEAIGKIIKSKDLRDKLSKIGIIHSKDFSWQKTAKETLAIYNLIK
ncbi:MAG: glycosyltransferase family 1 protein [Candidatus Shapirobacteria bacterium]